MKPREIRINPVLNGFIVNVGCQTVVFQSVTELILELNNYLKDPAATEDKYRKAALYGDPLAGAPQDTSCMNTAGAVQSPNWVVPQPNIR